METILSRIAAYRNEMVRLQQEIARLEREHEKEILSAALRDRQDAGVGAVDVVNAQMPKAVMSRSEAGLIEAALNDREGVEGGESL
jgi:hypothetical protein